MKCPLNSKECFIGCTFYNLQNPITADGECIIITMAKTINAINLNLLHINEELRLIRFEMVKDKPQFELKRKEENLCFVEIPAGKIITRHSIDMKAEEFEVRNPFMFRAFVIRDEQNNEFHWFLKRIGDNATRGGKTRSLEEAIAQMNIAFEKEWI